MIGREARAQIVEMAGRLPDACIACVGGGSNAIGLFHAFRDDAHVELIGVEAGGAGIERQTRGAFCRSDDGAVGVLHGTKTFVLQNADGQMPRRYDFGGAGLCRDRAGASVSAPQRRAHTLTPPMMRHWMRFQFVQWRASFRRWNLRTRWRGDQRAPKMEKTNFAGESSGRGDKDLDTVMKALDKEK